jgi:acetolactate synthase I/II/III large subunit
MAAGTDFILDALTREGLNHLFMVPGGLVDPFLPALARHPSFRASGRFGAALGIGGTGLCNMATAAAAAKTDSSPVLILSGEIPLDMEGLGEFQDASQATLDDTAIMKPITRFSTTVASARNLDHWLRHALTAMLAQPSGPVHLSLTHNALTEDCAADRAHRREDREKLPDAGL